MRFLTFATVLSLSITVLLNATNSTVAADRAKVPQAEKVAESRKLIHDLFKAEFAVRNPRLRARLAGTLLKQAEGSKGDLPARYALLTEARELAIKGGDILTAMKATQELANSFEVPRGKLWVELATPMLAYGRTPQATRDLAILFLAKSDEASKDDDWDSALTLARSAETAAKRSRNISLLKSARELRSRVSRVRADISKFERALRTLKSDPADKSANLTAGKYYCIRKQHWTKGIPLLARGSNEKLKAAALADTKANDGPDTKLAAADEWYSAAKTAPKEERAAYYARAFHWYQKALPSLKSPKKAEIQARLEELQPLIPIGAGSEILWSEVRAAIKGNTYTKARIIGGAFSRETFEEIPSDGAILIGFKYSTVSNGRYPGVVQAIYQTAASETLGRGFGQLEQGASLQVVKAKPGYAVGAIYTRGGGGFDAFKPIFMRVKGKGLDVDDKYEGPHIGGKGGSEGTLGGDGSFIIGIHGRVGKKGKIQALSTVTLGNASPTSPPPRR